MRTIGDNFRALQDAWLDRIERRWQLTVSAQCFISAALTVPFLAGFALLLHYYLNHPERASFLDPRGLRELYALLLAALGGWAALIVAAVLARKRRPNSKVLMHVLVQYYTVSLAVFAHYMGTLVNLTWVIATAAVVLAFFFWDTTAVIGGIVSFFTLMGVSMGGNLMGWLPYAPLLARAPHGGGRIEPTWLLAMGGTTYLIGIAGVTLIGSVITRLRQRTGQLEKALEEKEKTQEQLLASERLATMGEYVAAIFHELRNPVAGVASVLEDVTRALRETEDERFLETVEDLEFSLKQQRRATGFIRSLLDLSRQREGYDELVDVNAVTRDALQVLRVQFKQQGVEFAEELSEGLPPVRGNFAQLGQVCLNLGRNAAEALLEAGSADLRVTFETALRDGRVEIRCKDRGPGISEAAIPRMFDSFYTTKKAGQGTGLGLYLSRRVAESHGGRIAGLNREDGAGAIFILSLPAALPA